MPSDSSLDPNALVAAIDANRIVWKRHAIQRMKKRDIKRSDVLTVLRAKDRIEDYPNDYPYPSALFLGWIAGVPLHVVAALDVAGNRAIIITVYEPDLVHFEANYRIRR
jgi:hypothetical protein